MIFLAHAIFHKHSCHHLSALVTHNAKSSQCNNGLDSMMSLSSSSKLCIYTRRGISWIRFNNKCPHLVCHFRWHEASLEDEVYMNKNLFLRRLHILYNWMHKSAIDDDNLNWDDEPQSSFTLLPVMSQMHFFKKIKSAHVCWNLHSAN